LKKYKLLIAILTILCVLITIIANKPYKSTDEYLKRNYSNLNLEDKDDFSGLEILSEDIKNKKIIFTGEHHNLAQNHVVKLKLLKYLQKEIGVNYLLHEVGYADSYFLNKYLESGDETILKNYFEIYKNHKYYTEENYNELVEIYKFNQTLPKDKRIKVVGADIQSKATYDYILDVVKDEEKLTDELKVLIDELKDFDYYNKGAYENLLNILNKLNKDIDTNEEKYKDIFKENLNEFKLVIKNITDMSKVYTSDEKYLNDIRDRYIYENFKIIDSQLKNPVYFGQWGGFHVFQDTFYSNIDSLDIKYFSSLLNKDEKYKDKVLSITYGYYFEKSVLQHSEQFINEDIFKDYINSKSKATIFRLNNKKSPFKEKSINVFSRNSIDYKDNPTTNYFQYLILIRNSEESKIVWKNIFNE
jgi:hypothetical protein